MARQRLVAGNWKMNGIGAQAAELDAVIAGAGEAGADMLICPPATLIADFARRAAGTDVRIGGQDCHPEPKGAHTGDLAAEMLADAGASHVILGHSERRADHGETDVLVRNKVLGAWRAGLVAIACIGETEAQRDAGETLEVVAGQLGASLPDGATPLNTVVAYEPVWAIGTGRTPSPSDIAEVHDAMRSHLATRFGAAAAADLRLLYGGSVKASNAAEIFAIADVDGALVGGASLKASEFLAIARAAEA